MTDTPTVTAPVVSGDVVTPVTFPANRMLLTGLLGMVAALAFLVWTLTQQRDELRAALSSQNKRWMDEHYPDGEYVPATPVTPNGKFHGPVNASTDAKVGDSESSAEVSDL